MWFEAPRPETLGIYGTGLACFGLGETLGIYGTGLACFGLGEKLPKPQSKLKL